MTTLQSWRISLKEYHIMLNGYKEQLLDKYEFASVQALFNRNAQSDKIKSLADIYTRPESVRDIENKHKSDKKWLKRFKETNRSLIK